jgi:hypothetical protein
MGDLDDRFRRLGQQLGDSASSADFSDVLRRRRRQFVRRSAVAIGTTGGLAAAVAWAAVGAGTTDTLHQTPAGPVLPTVIATPNLLRSPAPDVRAAAHRAYLRANIGRQPFQPSDLSFADSTHGFVVGERCFTTEDACRSAVQTSSDGGRSWRAAGMFGPLTTLDGLGADRILATGSNVIWAYDPELFVSTDGGANFRQIGAMAEVTHVVAGGNAVWVVEQQSRDGAPVRTTIWSTPADGTGGLRPLPAQPSLGHQVAQSLARPTPQTAFVIGGPYSIYETADGGQSWQRENTPCGSDFRSTLSADSSRSLWLLCAYPGGAGQQAKSLFRSVDGGHSWTKKPALETSGYAATVDAISASTAWRWGATRSAVWRTTDGGGSWQPGPVGGGDVIPGFAAISDTTAWAVSKDYASRSDTYYVWRTTDGVHWSKAPLAP